uniref:GMP reductase n=1 Tax=Hucho hucho TaxID=62062 RepID=A0A4W5LNS5_9TELE
MVMFPTFIRLSALICYGSAFSSTHRKIITRTATPIQVNDAIMCGSHGSHFEFPHEFTSQISMVRGSRPVLTILFLSSGSGQADLEKLCSILEAVSDIRFICLDVANGYSEHFVEYVKTVRGRFPQHTIMAGNVVTGEMVEELILAGADIIKVGIGPGSVCTTRIKTGCADSAHGLKGHIISVRCNTPAQYMVVCAILGAGADFVMLGGMLAGHDQCAGEVIEKNGRKVKLFYGMSSDTAMKKHVGGVAEYRASEGRTVEVPYRGDVEATIRDILGGLRSTCTYVGAAKLKELSRRTTFIRVTQQASHMFT